jgi:hypothetical protein
MMPEPQVARLVSGNGGAGIWSVRAVLTRVGVGVLLSVTGQVRRLCTAEHRHDKVLVLSIVLCGVALGACAVGKG